ncbi:MAG: hypothetical protein LBL43_01650 [Treponema sp.]|nr:hypothetical protein [Treponema sp.]
MNKPYVKLFFLCVIFLRPLSAGAADFGLALNQEAKTSNEAGGDGAFFYTPTIKPWLSASPGESVSLYLSAGVGFDYTADFGGGSAWRSPAALPEIERTELTWTASPSLYVRLGRQRFRDPAGLIAAGLFDGLSAGFSAGGGRFSLGAWYTGLLYRDTADIVMTARDQTEYQEPYSLKGGYFASRRGMVSFEWENPGLGPRSSLALGVLGQFDLNGGGDKFHSQYLSARYGFRPSGSVELGASGVFGIGEDPEFAVFFAGGLGLTWTPPGGPEDRVSFQGLYSSPSGGERLKPFIPVSSVPQGEVFGPALRGVSVFRGSYTLRPRPSLTLTGEVLYFIRTDTVSFTDSREPGKLKGEGYFLGGECYGAAVWSPLPDFALTLGGGAFFPRIGNAFTEDAAIRWKAAAGVILSL